MTTAHEKRIAHYESSTKSLLEQKEMFESQCDTLRTELDEERRRGQSLMELNQALKENVMSLHSEKEELEESIDAVQQKFMELSQSQSEDTTIIQSNENNNNTQNDEATT